MTKLIDKEYANAIRFYLDNTFFNSKQPESAESVDLNLIRPFSNYIKSLAPEGFLFSTPLFAWWDLTSACNFRCIHCLYNDTEYSAQNDLTTSEAMNLADSLINDFRISGILLTGGEIFLRKDTMDIIRKFKENNVSVKMATNAALLDDSQIDCLAEMLNPYIDGMQISLDGATHETYKKIRQTNLFEKVISNIKKLAERNITITISCTVNTVNYNEIEEIYKLSSELGVNCFVAGRMYYFNKSHENLILSNRDLMLLASRLYKLDTSSCKTKLIAGPFSSIELFSIPGIGEILEEDKYKPVFEKYTIPVTRNCNCHDRLSIRSDGSVYMCMQAQGCKDALMGNIRQTPIAKIWENRQNNILFQKRLLEKMKCKNCKYNVICNSGCMAHAYNNNGSINTPEMPCTICKQS